LALALTLTVPPTSAINLRLLQYDPVRQLTQSDWALESETCLTAVEETPDSAVTARKIPEPGQSGTIRQLDRSQGVAGQACHKINATFTSKRFDYV
jgi:hypothetical protein